MAWIYLLVAAAFEITFATSMKLADGFTRLGPTLVTAVAVAGGIFFLTLALKHLPLSVGYPAWVGIGTLGTVLLGVTWFGEALTILKVASVVAITGGVIGLKLASAG